MYRGIVRLLSSLALCALSLATAYADPGSEALDNKSYEMYQQVFSPFCPGRSLNDCPSSKAQELKAEMRQKLEQGTAPEIILEGVFAQFGDKYRAVPVFEGFGRMVWIAPFGFVVIGLIGAIIVVLRRKKGDLRSNSRTQIKISAALQDRINQELTKLD